MGRETEIRPVPRSACAAVVELHRSLFPPSEVARTPMGAPGAARYLADEVADGGASDEHQLVGAWEGDRLAGYLHGRRIGTAWHLNYVAVAPDRGECGLGSRLFAAWEAEGRRRVLARHTLDVAADNRRAAGWYLRRGFARRAAWRWSESAAARSPDRRPPEVFGAADAERRHQRWGLSELTVAVAGRRVVVGRIGDDLFRLLEEPTPRLLRALAALDPGRRVVYRAPAELDDRPREGLVWRMERTVAVDRGPAAHRGGQPTLKGGE